jgi:hypothetical protein
MMNEWSVDITLDGWWTLTREQVWPDGDGPEHPTARDVADAMNGHAGGLSSILGDWGLDDYNIVVTTPDGRSASVL